jgi:hypothetical protein
LRHTDGWAGFGGAGARLRRPRTEELERRPGDPGGGSSSGHKPPQLWLTALAHLATGVPWPWQVGKGDASERAHLARLVGTLMAGASVVTDAGYQAYPLACSLADAGAPFPTRVSSQTSFYTADVSPPTEPTGSGAREVTPGGMGPWEDRAVYYGPRGARQNGGRALPVRLLRVRARRRRAPTCGW